MNGFILNLQYPKSLKEADALHKYWLRQNIDLECISNYEALAIIGKDNNIGYWNAPYSAMPGDICFFACAKSAQSYISALKHEAELVNRYDLLALVQASSGFYKHLGGCIFGIAHIAEKPILEPGKSRVSPGWAKMRDYHSISSIKIANLEFLTLNNFGGITKLNNKAFKQLCLEIGINETEKKYQNE